MDREALNVRLLAMFVEELDELVQAMNGDLLALERDAADAERLRSLFRAAHTLKGAARAAGVPIIENACHALEELLTGARDREQPLDAIRLQLLFSAADALAEAGQRVRAGESLAGTAIDGIPRAVTRIPLNAEPPPRPEAQASPALPPEATPAVLTEPSRPIAPRRAGDVAAIRIPAERLDELLATAGEFLALGRRAEARSREMEEVDAFHGEWSAAWQRDLPRLLVALGPQALPAQRDLLLGVSDRLRQLGEKSRRLARQTLADARQISRAGDSLADQVRRVRMRPIQEAVETLPRALRDLTSAAGKEVRLEISGGEVEVDRGILDALRDAILPAVRNAVDHGIETPEERVAAGKPAEATLSVSAQLWAERVVVTIADDGRGVDATLLRARLRAAGTPAGPDDRDLGVALLAGGVSSRVEATTISGRGVGLDIVRAAMERVRGHVELTWVRGGGTTVRLECPPSLATLRALLVSVGTQVLALPTATVERVLRVVTADLGTLEGRPIVDTPEGPLPLVSLARILGPPLVDRPASRVTRVVIVAARGQRAAVVVDEFVAEEELVLRPLQTGRAPLAMIAGAAILGSGVVAPLIDAAALVAAAQSTKSSPPAAASSAEGTAGSRRILVADDSLTTRTLEQSVLEAAGYHVTTAVDGLDALRLLQEREIELLVSDVEMPRMDGFGLCEAIRASPRLRPLPVVLVTARESPEDRARGLEAGADAYLPKSSFDQDQLLATVRELLG